MSSLDSVSGAVAPVYGQPLSPKEQWRKRLPAWSLDYTGSPIFDGASGLWFFGNVKLLGANLGFVPTASGRNHHSPAQLDAIEAEAESLVLDRKVLVCGIHSPAHMRAAVVPLRWGSPRIVVFSGGFRFHLGPDLNEEPFRAARLWRYCWDPITDLAVSRRAPDKLPTYACHNPTVDRLIEEIARSELSLSNGSIPMDLRLP